MLPIPYQLDLAFSQTAFILATNATPSAGPTQERNADVYPMDLGSISPARFAELAKQTIERLECRTSREVKVPGSFSQRNSNNDKFRLQARAWELWYRGEHLSTLRMVLIQSAKNEIINTWVFPKNPSRLPVYAAELIAVAGTVRVAFVDIQTPCMSDIETESVHTLTQKLADRYRDFPADEPAPQWAIEASTGNYAFARGLGFNELPRVHECYLGYLDTYLKSFAGGRWADTAIGCKATEKTLGQLDRYQKHHLESSPGKKFLGNLFGEDWTDQFLHQFLFTRV